MSGICPRMPDLIKIDEFDNDWNKYLDYLYSLYLNDFFYNTVYFNGLQVKTFTQLQYNCKQETFNHITTQGSNDRLYNLLRCERYNWIKTIIEGKICYVCDEIAIWEERRKKKQYTLIWCRSTNFLIVLKKRKECYYLTTAYCVTYPNKERDLRISYNKFIEKNRSRLT